MRLVPLQARRTMTLMASTPGIRAATEHDAAAIARVQVESWKATYRGIVLDALLAGLNVEERAARWREILKSGTYIFVAEQVAVWVFGANPACRFCEATGAAWIGGQTREIGGVTVPLAAYGWTSLKALSSALRKVS